MNNKNLITALAAGVAAAVVAGIVLRRTGALQGIMDKLRHLADSVDEHFADQTMGMQDIIPKGEDRNVSASMQQN